MSASLSEQNTARARKIVDDVLEPKIKRLVEEANKILDKHGIVIGCEVQWFLDKKESTNATPKKD